MSGEPAKANLRLLLLETALWCNSRADIDRAAECLRTPSLAPYLFNDSRHDTLYDVAFSRHEALVSCGAIHRVAGLSSALVDSAMLGVANPLDVISAGRLLVWHRDKTIDDGAGEAETSGYLDVSDMPPWDTWVVYVDIQTEAPSGFLVSWVPMPFVAMVERAVAINAYDALYWLRDSRLPIAALLETDGLLV